MKNSGMGFLSVMALVFIVLKLCKVITWSWWWVLAPLWLPSGIAAFIGIVWFLFWMRAVSKRNSATGR
jgi:hypothetical protein